MRINSQIANSPILQYTRLNLIHIGLGFYTNGCGKFEHLYCLVLNHMRILFPVTLLLFIVAVIGTVLGGMVLAFDNSLWPIDAYVLTIGQYAHLAVVPVSFVTFIYTMKSSESVATKTISILIFCISAVTLWLTWDAILVYGYWPNNT